jgi:hypothetical protein
MSKNDLASLRNRLATTLARATLMQAQRMQRMLRKDRTCERNLFFVVWLREGSA